MNLKIFIALLFVLLIIFGIVKLMGTVQAKRSSSPSYIQETVGLQNKAKALTEQREKQIEERKEIWDYEEQ